MGMRERAVLVNGSFSLRSSPGGGTTVTARLPLLGAGSRRPGDLASAPG
jgi:signal transduction histidine kinase